MSYPQSTAYTVTMQLFIAGTNTPATGKTAAVTISKAGAAFGNPSAGAVNATEISGGFYSYALSTTDMNTVGDTTTVFTATGCDPGVRILPTVNANNGGLSALPNTACTTNASLLTSGTGTDQVSVASGKVLLQATQTGVTIPTVTTVGTLTTYTGNTPQTGDAYGYLTTNLGALGANLTALPALIWNALTSGITTTGSIGLRIVNFLTGDAYARLGAPAGASTSADIAAVKASVGTPMQAYTQPTGFLAATFPTSVASPTNITAGTITTTTNLTNAPTNGDLTATMKASVTSAVPTVTAIQSGLATASALETAQTGITSIVNKLPANNIADETLVLTAIGTPAQTADLDARIPNNIAMTGGAVWSLDASGNPIAPASATTSIISTLSGLVAAIWAAGSRTLTAFGFTVATDKDSEIDAVYNKLPTNNIADQTSLNTIGTELGAQLGQVYGIVDSGTFGNAALLAAIQAGGGGGSGTGPNVVTVTCRDSNSNLLANVVVGAQQSGIGCGTDTTASGGTAVLNVPSGETTFLGVLTGYQFATPVTQDISGNTSVNLVLTQLAITPSPPTLLTGWLVCYDQFGIPLAGVVHTLQLKSSPNVDVGSSLSMAQVTDTSAATTGLVQFTGLRSGGSYQVKRANGSWFQFTAEDSGNGTFSIADCIG